MKPLEASDWVTELLELFQTKWRRLVADVVTLETVSNSRMVNFLWTSGRSELIATGTALTWTTVPSNMPGGCCRRRKRRTREGGMQSWFLLRQE